ncbi:hypothetical protein O6H91_08G042300 [Diphasiastrum complanatum]|uniref:Uncharacterized protein n=9 Tax=Diphasiastrum complanatum TaxID=34168 RepID=A0ACC2CXW2_DIPCM|nr:hypothetical protein O6H91_08G042300 [Diphasiastrum complanatum]KAJ7546506.1 hypothetical protein O6H91_08G042300 [Diphasiastrum complanatum]KAJ7546507.1 hypothetical protein O6H91_08G042300 [Diphasiastrum complanatum]KAJ7546508.1 hypothetical protein O6H91_08G042300 [Diphasiastrum complanatum]KAJ7546509.1 hypothetical protein O6H91_08G042300 [Diphasiastrum complanatum]
MDPRVEDLLRSPIVLAERTRRAVEEADSFRQECADLSRQVERLAHSLRQAARLSNNSSGGLYLRATKRILEEVEKSLEKALALVKKCKRSGILKRVITITSATDFRRVNAQLESSIEDMKWLLTVSASGDERSEFAGLPPIAANDPNLAFIWEQIAHLQVGSSEEKCDAAAYLVTLAADSERNGKIIIEEGGGLHPLLKLLSEGPAPGQEVAAKALGVLASDQQRVQEILKVGAVQPFVQILIDAPMKVQTQVAVALGNMVSHDPETQNAFGAAGAIRHLVTLLAYETIVEPASMKNALNMHTLVKTSMSKKKIGNRSDAFGIESDQRNHGGLEERPNAVIVEDPASMGRTGDQWLAPKSVSPSDKKSELLDDSAFGCQKPTHHFRTGSDSYMSFENGRGLPGSSLKELNRKEREQEDQETKLNLKAEVARALWKLAENNVKNSKSITDTRALLCFARLIETAEGDIQRNSIMAVMEIAAAAERDQELRRAAFKIISPAVRAVVEQLLRVIEEGEPELQIPSLKAIGSLSRIFPAKETRVVRPLTVQLGNKDLYVAAEAAKALQKFTVHENYLRVQHSKTILEARGAESLVHLAYSGDQAQIPAIILLCYIALNAADDVALKKAQVLQSLEFSSRATVVMQVPAVREILPHAIEHLELYQSGSVHLPNGFV